MTFLRALAALVLISLLLTLPAHAEDLIVSAAASLTNAFKEIGAEFEKALRPQLEPDAAAPNGA